MQGLVTDCKIREPETQISPQRWASPPKTKMGKSPVKIYFAGLQVVLALLVGKVLSQILWVRK